MLMVSNLSSLFVDVIVGCHDNICEGFDVVVGETDRFCNPLGIDEDCSPTDGLIDGVCDALGVGDGLAD